MYFAHNEDYAGSIPAITTNLSVHCWVFVTDKARSSVKRYWVGCTIQIRVDCGFSKGGK